MVRKGINPVIPQLACAAALACVPAEAAFRFFDPADPSRVPRKLSETGFYDDLSRKAVTPGAIPFEVNAPLWSDGAAKQRWIVLPPGKSIPYRDSVDAFDYPDSAVFVKTFLLERIPGAPESRVLWETRLLVNRQDADGSDSWHPFTYRWNADQSDAVLVDAAQGLDTLFRTGAGVQGGPGTYVKWRYPSAEDCRSCHNTGKARKPEGRAVLGFFPAQLKHPRALREPGISQLAYLFRQRIFSGAPPDDRFPGPRWKGLEETLPARTEPSARFRALDTMARSYLAANCSGCHGARGIANPTAQNLTTGINFDFHAYQPASTLENAMARTFRLDSLFPAPDPKTRPAGHGLFLDLVRSAGLDASPGAWNMALPPPQPGPEDAVLKPGYPSLSIALFRQLDRRSPREDSLETLRTLLTQADFIRDTATARTAKEKLGWMFSAPWGSPAWFDLGRARGHDVKDLIASRHIDFQKLTNQMPPLAAYLPHREALLILGEWVSRMPGAVGIRRPAPPIPDPRIRLVGRRFRLSVPPGEKVSLHRLDGSSLSLHPAGDGWYELPVTTPPGLVLIKVGGILRRATLW